jgi:hypothetical protein
MNVTQTAAAAAHPYNGPAKLAADNDGDGRKGAAALSDGDAAAQIANRAIAQQSTGAQGTSSQSAGSQGAGSQGAASQGAASQTGSVDLKA